MGINIFGILAGVIGVVGAVPYIRDTFYKKTKPHRTAWLIFLIFSVIAFTSQLALGARSSLLFYGWVVINNTVIFGLSLRKDNGFGGIDRINIVMFSLALLGIVLWQTINSPLSALLCFLVADGIGVALIAIKSYRNPNSETIAMWCLGILAGGLNVLAAGFSNWTTLVAPASLIFFSGFITLAILLGRKRQVSVVN